MLHCGVHGHPVGHVVIGLDVLIEVLYLVLAQGCIGLQRQPLGHVHTGCDFGTYALALLDIGGEVLADVALLTGLYKLVVVEHGIEVYAGIPYLACVIVAELHIMHALCLGSRV